MGSCGFDRLRGIYGLYELRILHRALLRVLISKVKVEHERLGHGGQMFILRTVCERIFDVVYTIIATWETN